MTVGDDARGKVWALGGCGLVAAICAAVVYTAPPPPLPHLDRAPRLAIPSAAHAPRELPAAPRLAQRPAAARHHATAPAAALREGVTPTPAVKPPVTIPGTAAPADASPTGVYLLVPSQLPTPDVVNIAITHADEDADDAGALRRAFATAGRAIGGAARTTGRAMQRAF